MNKTVKIAVCCGGGIFTTTVVTGEIENFLKSKGISHKISPHKITEIANMTGYDIIVATGKTDAKNKDGAPVLIGLPLFTNVGAEEFKELLLNTINSLE